MGRVHLLSQPLRLLRFACVPKKIVDILDSRPGKNSLVTDATVFLLKVSEQLHFQIIPGCEVGVSAFACKRMMPESIPIEARHSESGASRDHGPVSFGIFCTFAQGDEILRFKSIDAVSVGLQIVEQADGTEFELLG